jgi:Fic family protein
MNELLTSIAAKKKRLDELRPLSPAALATLEHYYDIELTWTSNAIEGNTLSQVETTLVIKKELPSAANRSKITLRRSTTTKPSVFAHRNAPRHPSAMRTVGVRRDKPA